MKNGRRWEQMLCDQLDAEGFAGRYTREHKFLSDRRFRFDIALLPERFAIEVDGQTHSIRKRRESDAKKFQLALMAGWRVLHVLPSQVRSGEALSLVKRLL